MNTQANSSHSSGQRETAPSWAVAMDRCLRYLTEDLGGGPRVIRIAQMINFHKVITVFLIYGMMVYFDNYSTAAWIYLALHGTYGYCSGSVSRCIRWVVRCWCPGAYSMATWFSTG